ncbi:monocarboxylate transporter 14-like [Mya arenaria]|uniref:monocarboxylate transporter 14-like n=1 Tax=Mya arenaria TaxID=6604 RepID=UPI0022E3018E|nr:monocarboxylate transporter 14-like [Mya arenaria]XP_052803031.1 monocarboxylate transporter 14-like [Mya arenaria]XP_052803032.1 monocarboxylate transporter 14-like [Mya arenaria]
MARRPKEAPGHGDTEEGSDSLDSSEFSRAPDGGWGWMVCLGSFLINFMLDGTMFSFGVLLLELLDYFGQGKAKTSWIGSSLLGMSMFMGPVVSILLERYTCRQITIVGTLISVVAFVVSIFSPNVEMLIITYGIIAGVGFSMSFISAIIVVGLYFNRRRAIATGIAMSGSGLGTFAYAYITDMLISQYDWRGTILILAGVLLNGVVCGILFRPLSDCYTVGRESSSEYISGPSDSSKGTTELRKLLLERKYKEMCDEHDYDVPKIKNMSCRLTVSTANMVRLPADTSVFLEAREFSSQTNCLRTRLKPMKNQMSGSSVFYSGSLNNLKHRHTVGYHRSDEMVKPSVAMDNENVAGTCQGSSTLADILKTNINLFRDKIFVLLLLTNVCWTVQSVPLTYIPDLGVTKSLTTSEAATLISIVGITNIIGRILSGLITDCLNVNCTHTYIVTLFMASAVSFLMPWCNGFATLAICSGVFGLCMATHVSMRTIVLADHLGIERLTRSFGLVALFQGIAFLTNAPLAGFLYETFDSYVMPFSFAGMMYFLSGLFCLAVLCLDKHTNRGIEIIIESRNVG